MRASRHEGGREMAPDRLASLRKAAKKPQLLSWAEIKEEKLNEKITMVMSGALKFTIDGKDTTVLPGEVFVIPPNVVHSAVALEDSDDFDAFSPLRLDWLKGDDAYLRTGKSTLKK